MNLIPKGIQRIATQIKLVYTGEKTPDIKTVSGDKKRRISDILKLSRTYLGQAQQDTLDNAILEAEDPCHPNRLNLLEIYRQAMRDRHLRSLIRTAIFNVISEPWAVVDKKTKTIDADKTALLNKKWFRDAQKLYLEAEFYGFSPIEMGQMIFDKDLNGWVFTESNLFPREHVRPETLEIVLDPYTTSPGFPINEAPFNTWLLFAGSKTDIGLLHILARGAIYNRFTESDWSRSNEKWSDPLLHIGTDSDDEAENNNKAEMAANFGKNGWVITDKDDSVTIVERKNSDAYKAFLDFINVQNDLNSKGVNGQTGTTDEKAFVGSAEVHERQLDKYTEARLQDMTDWSNDSFLPYLIQCNEGNSVYKQLDGYMVTPLRFLKELKDPNQEADKIDNEIDDPDNNNDPKKAGNGGAARKKPLNKLGGVLTKLYDNCNCGKHIYSSTMSYESSTIDMDKYVQKAISRTYNKKLRAGQVDAGLYQANANAMWDGIKEGWQKDPQKLKYGSAEHRLMLNMRHNVHVTAAFKTHHNTLEMSTALFDENGKMRSKNEYIKAAKQINGTYNKTWLNTEYDLAKASARMGAKWTVYQAKGGKLIYMTVGDGRVRDEHRILHKVCKSVNDAFWLTYYPPNGWKCRCYVIWVPDDEPDVEPTSLPDMPPMFKNNVGVTGKIFTDDHPYFNIAQQFKKDAAKTFNVKLPISPDQLSENVTLYEHLSGDVNYSLEYVDNLNGGYVFKSKLARAAETADNLPVAKILAGEGKAVTLLEWDAALATKQPDFNIGTETAELKTIAGTSYNNIDQAIRTAKDQSGRIILNITGKYSSDALEKAIYARTIRSKGIKEITLVINNKAIVLSREEIVKRTFIGKF